MSTPHEKKLNREKQKRFQERYKARLRHEYQTKRAQEDVWKAPKSGNWAVAIIDGRPAVTASEGLVGGLTAASARRIASALRKLLGVDHRRGPQPHRGKAGRPVERLHPDGTVERFDSITAAAQAMGVDRMVITRRVCDGRPDRDRCTWSDYKA